MTGGVILFGKLPLHGDFVARGLPPAERLWWDERLSAGMADLDRPTPSDGPDAIWRFRLERQGAPVNGAIAPSRDRSGRVFPVMLALHAGRGAAHCEAMLRLALTEGWDADRLHAETAMAAPPPEEPEPPVRNGWWRSGETPVEDGDPAAIVGRLLNDRGRSA